MHVLIKGNYEITFLVQPGTDCFGWFSHQLFADVIHGIPELDQADVQSEIRQENIIVYRGHQGIPAVKVTATVSVADDIQGRHDVNGLRNRMFQAFTPLVGSLKARSGCIDAYQSHPDVKITEVVRDHFDNQVEFRKSGVFPFHRKKR